MLPLHINESPTRIVIACRRRSFCRAIRALLSTYQEFEIIAETSTGQGALSIAEQYHPDVVLLDICISTPSSIRATKRIKRLCPGTSVLLLTINEDSPLEAQTAGADGILDVGVSPDEIITAIRNAAQGNASRTRRESHSV